MKKRNVMALLGIVTVVTVGYTLTGCGCSRVENNVSVNEVTVSENVIVSENIADEEDEIGTTQEQESSVTWIEVGKLETNPELRKAFDEIFGVNGDTGAKDGWVYKTQNITLQDALDNEDTILVIYGLTNEEFGIVNEDRPKLAEASGEAYVDTEELTEDEQIAIVLNSYFNLLPDSEAGYSNPYETLTRAQAMALLMRATTPVSDIKADDAFSEAVGEGDYNTLKC